MTIAEEILALKASTEDTFKECMNQVSFEDFNPNGSSVFTFVDGSKLYQHKGQFKLLEDLKNDYRSGKPMC